jgi:hypothetical protein
MGKKTFDEFISAITRSIKLSEAALSTPLKEGFFQDSVGTPIMRHTNLLMNELTLFHICICAACVYLTQQYSLMVELGLCGLFVDICAIFKFASFERATVEIIIRWAQNITKRPNK